MLLNITELEEAFGLMTEWEDRYAALLDMARHLPVMEESLKNEQTLVRGCTSRVWLVSNYNVEGRLEIVADSDSHLVKGLIAVLFAAYQGKEAAEVLAFDIEGFFKTLGLESNLTPNRRNGFFAMVERLKAQAADYIKAA